MSGEWLESLEVQTYVARMLASEQGDLWEEHFGRTADGVENPRLREFATHARAGLLRSALEGEPFWVSRDMAEFARVAAETWPGESLLANHLPTRKGFVVLERSLTGSDLGHGAQAIRAFCWHETGVITDDGKTVPGVFVGLLSDRDAPEDDTFRDLAQGDPGLFAQMPKWFPIHAATWKYGHDTPTIGNYETGAAKDWGMKMEFFPFIRTFWSLVQQEIPHVSHPRPSRPWMRMLSREGYKHISSVKVVDLRRYKTSPRDDEEGGDERPVEWTHRWTVRGHWRNQYYPSEGVHRLKYIHPFVKGPEHLPLVTKRTIHRVVR